VSVLRSYLRSEHFSDNVQNRPSHTAANQYVMFLLIKFTEDLTNVNYRQADGS